MVRSSTIFAALATASSALAQTTCGLDSKCPSDTPCCSQYGQCGVGAYCLGGCDPRSSFSLDSCVPEPVCKSTTTNFNSLSSVVDQSKYLGDATTAEWVSQGEPVIYNNNLLLTMAEGTVGTLLASTGYVWYGNIKATLKTSRGAGVVTAFILLSDVKDEIDYEFVGTELTTAQTNYYFQGIPDYDNSANLTLSDTFENFHTYEIHWTPDYIQWMVDGQVGRTKYRNETWNATANQWNFPQTPARVEMSLWPGGASTNAPGTIAWAGGPISFSDSNPDIAANGYYYATFESVTIDCYNATSAPGTNTGVSYTYNSAVGTNNTVVDGNEPTVLKSLLGTGTNMSVEEPSASASGTSTTTAPTIPGESGVGPGGQNPGGVDSGSASTSSSASGSTSSSSSSGFSQGSGSSGSSKSGADKFGSQERVLKGSIFAGIVAVVAMLAL